MKPYFVSQEMFYIHNFISRSSISLEYHESSTTIYSTKSIISKIYRSRFNIFEFSKSTSYFPF